MSITVAVTVVKTIKLESDAYLEMLHSKDGEEKLKAEFDLYNLDDWCWDDESMTVEILKTEDVYLENDLE